MADDLAVLRALVVAPEQIRNRPDEGGMVLDGGFGHAGFEPPFRSTSNARGPRLLSHTEAGR